MREVEELNVVYNRISDAEDNLVYDFSDHMRERLVANQHKTPWTDETVDLLFPRMEKKFDDIKSEFVVTGRCDLKKLADLANYAAMIGDLADA